MDPEKLRRLKLHALFGGALTLIFVVSLTLKIASGERLLQASWNSFKEIRPVEWMMILLFWYSAAFHKPRDEWSSNSMTTLGLSEKR